MPIEEYVEVALAPEHALSGALPVTDRTTVADVPAAVM
jgi:hypothetical protein